MGCLQVLSEGLRFFWREPGTVRGSPGSYQFGPGFVADGFRCRHNARNQAPVFHDPGAFPVVPHTGHRFSEGAGSFGHGQFAFHVETLSGPSPRGKPPFSAPLQRPLFAAQIVALFVQLLEITVQRLLIDPV